MLLYREQDSQLEVYLGRRKYRPYAGHWSIPGGAIDAGDGKGVLNAPLDAAIRELQEETGLAISVGAETQYPYVRFRLPFVFSFWTFLIPFPEAATIRPVHEFDQADWFPVDRLPHPLHIGVGRAVRRLKRIKPRAPK